MSNNEEEKRYIHLNLNKQELRKTRIENSSHLNRNEAQVGEDSGLFYYDTFLKKILFWDGSDWKIIKTLDDYNIDKKNIMIDDIWTQTNLIPNNNPQSSSVLEVKNIELYNIENSYIYKPTTDIIDSVVTDKYGSIYKPILKNDNGDIISNSINWELNDEHVIIYSGFNDSLNISESKKLYLTYWRYIGNKGDLNSNKYLKKPVKYATISNLNAIYDNASSGVNATLSGSSILNIDGNTALIGDRILVKNQTNSFENGIYEMKVDGINWVMSRSSDFDGSVNGDINGGEFVFVLSGNTLSNTEWLMKSPNSTPLIVGVTDINFKKISNDSVVTNDLINLNILSGSTIQSALNAIDLKFTNLVFVNYIDNGNVTINKNVNITITGGIFTEDTTVSIGGGIIINSMVIKSVGEIFLNITTSNIFGFFDIIVSNIYGTYTLSNTFRVLYYTLLIPGNTTPWYNISSKVDTTAGKLLPNVYTTSWTDKGANFGSVPANKNCVLAFGLEYITGITNGGFAMFGLTNSVGDYHFNTIDYGIYLSNGVTLGVYEGGLSKGSYGTFNINDVFKIKRINGVITYLKNDVVFYTSLIPSTTSLEFDCSIYKYLGAKNIKMTYQ